MTEKKRELKELKAQYKEQKQAIKDKYASDPYRAQKREERRLAKEERRRQHEELNRTMPKPYSLGEEIFNSVSHGIGAGLSIAGIVLLVVRAVVLAPAGQKGIFITSFAIYGASLLLLYIMSTLYHALTPYVAKNVFAVFDHCSIYILIAGTYTPVVLTDLPPALGWTYFGIIWGLAAFGCTMYAIYKSRMRKLSAITYLPMGLLIMTVIKLLAESMPAISIKFLIIGGALYVAGWPFYMMKKKKWMHCIFHLFVLAGSIFHFFCIYLSI
ncbi:MAG: hemolysin III family protein [Treponema sp.]|nr:hemolysin III family protein [Candidatus Treponema caballi]